MRTRGRSTRKVVIVKGMAHTTAWAALLVLLASAPHVRAGEPVDTEWSRIIAVALEGELSAGLEYEIPAVLFDGHGGAHVTTWRDAAEFLRVDGTGQVTMRTALDPDPSGQPASLFDCGDETICLQRGNRIEYRDRLAGTLRWSHTMGPQHSAWPPTMIAPRAESGILALHAHTIGTHVPSSTWTLTALDANGNVEATSSPLPGMALALGWPGAAVHKTGLSHIAPDGEITPYSGAEGGAVMRSHGSGVFDPGGRLVVPLRSSGGEQIGLERFHAGQRQWLIWLEETFPSTVNAPQTQLVADADGYFLLAHNSEAGVARVWRIDGNGEVQWHQEQIAGEQPAIIGHRHGRLVIAGGSEPADGLLVTVLDSDDGSVVVTRSFDCMGRLCAGARTALNDAGGLDALGTADDDDVPLFRYDDLIETPGIRLDQPGLSGNWYAEHTEGQGFTLRYFPASRTIFMPWFTLDRDDGDDPERLRWYTLQVDVDADAREAELPIYRSVGGRFDAPGRTLEAIGQATLRFASCREGTLWYRFDEGHNGGAEGSIALTRLLPLGTDCIEADGSTTAAEAAYDPAFTGHWYDPDTAGQGLEIYRVAADDEQDGFFFATWFTYDPDEPAGEAADQHWFTLQGQELTEGGGIRTTIVQTRGGRFDSESAEEYLEIGEAELSADACDRVQLLYSFDDVEAAGAFRGLSGEIALQRLGDCEGR